MEKHSTDMRSASDKAFERKHQNFWMDWEFFSQTVDSDVHEYGSDEEFCDAIGMKLDSYYSLVCMSRRHFK